MFVIVKETLLSLPRSRYRAFANCKYKTRSTDTDDSYAWNEHSWTARGCSFSFAVQVEAIILSPYKK